MYGNVYTNSTVASGSSVRTGTTTNLTWSNPSTSMYVGASGHFPIPYPSFDPGASTSTGYRQSSMFQFAPYPTMSMQFDYSQVIFTLWHTSGF